VDREFLNRVHSSLAVAFQEPDMSVREDALRECSASARVNQAGAGDDDAALI